MVDLDRIRNEVFSELSPRRRRHVEGVVATSLRFAERLGVDRSKAELAALLHDMCKEWPPERQAEVLRRHRDTLWLDYDANLWHAPCASYIARERFGVEDPLVLEAVYYHTTGRAAMSPLDLVLWVADYVEPSRDFPGVEAARALAEVDLYAAFCHGVRETILELAWEEEKIFPLALDAYNACVRRRRRQTESAEDE
ncbi:bis(5'-nucleosyl)-tetraphosphatase (symmetrical) YqeK [Brockia lithotrophica]|uniref:bis(5'-nucleosyl)-tetraphosphatase (symmetrical) n=1 Tax=Brockia lithotrophica TaxID=933949 RepID=A0A660LAB5_9BACL|nr:bis(5'-nucleosyl)-tetraphosphatase (symmetrical) YqeK [Brockia lithotrophica]RKQ88903.1 putative HD superfamily hydrolase involved in NAD metabolism [Brockia lithotrophica]